MSKDIKLREKVTAITKQAAEQVTSLKQVITKKDRDISEVNDMAISMVDEYNTLDKKQKAKSRESRRQIERHKKLAASQFKKLTESKQQATDLKASIDTIMEKHDKEMSLVEAKIVSLTISNFVTVRIR